jgi:hypothetical protein
MQYFCIEEFKVEFEKLVRKKSYKNLEQDIIEYFFDKDIKELCNGSRLNNSSETPYIKKRLNGSGGYRFYYYIILRQECLYFMFVHPKTGALGSENITDESKALIYKKVIDCIKSKDLYSVTKCSDNKKLIFNHLSNL